MKKFYTTAEAGTSPGGWVVRLNGKPLKTPLMKPLVFTSEGLAKAVAREWHDQKDEIVPGTMPLTQLANTLVDKASGDDRDEMDAQLQDYARSDLVCYFATHPQDLVARQETQWRPILEWLGDKKGIRLKTVSGIQYHQQDEQVMQVFDSLIAGLNALDFTCVQAVTATVGSVVIAVAFLNGFLDAEGAYQAACVDEIYQLEKWGEDEPARKRLDRIKEELAAVAGFYRLSKASS